MIDVCEAAERNRFEILVDHEVVGFTVFHVDGDTIAFPHVEVDAAYEHQGLASLMVRTALDTARERHQQVLPYCRFVSAYIDRHPEYLDLVPNGDRAGFGLQGVLD